MIKLLTLLFVSFNLIGSFSQAELVIEEKGEEAAQAAREAMPWRRREGVQMTRRPLALDLDERRHVACGQDLRDPVARVGARGLF